MTCRKMTPNAVVSSGGNNHGSSTSSWRQPQQHVATLYDDDDDEEANSATLPYHRALNDSMEQANNNMNDDNSFVNERSALLGTSRKRKSSSITPIHPLWNVHDEDEKQLPSPFWQCCCVNNSKRQLQESIWATLVCGVSLVHLSCMTMFDLYTWYLNVRLGLEFHPAWPWAFPSESTLIQFGAFLPSLAIQQEQYWRFLTSCMTSTSWIEWLLIATSWKALQHDAKQSPSFSKQPQDVQRQQHNTEKSFSLWFLYFGSVFTGQVFLAAFGNGMAGGASLGTCGVLCAKVIEQPQRRFVALVMSILLLVLDVVGPYSSIAAGLGSTAFGLACFYGILQRNDKRKQKSKKKSCCSTRGTSTVMLLALWIVPITWIALYGTRTVQ